LSIRRWSFTVGSCSPPLPPPPLSRPSCSRTASSPCHRLPRWTSLISTAKVWLIRLWIILSPCWVRWRRKTSLRWVSWDCICRNKTDWASRRSKPLLHSYLPASISAELLNPLVDSPFNPNFEAPCSIPESPMPYLLSLCLQQAPLKL